MQVTRVRKAYEQVADQLRELILAGELQPGARLPNEAMLAHDFGVSRATVREALRVLAAGSLIRTVKGAGGGSFVTLPTVDHISEFLHANISLLTESRTVTLEEFLEAREQLEVPAARLAARRRSEADLELLRAAVPDEGTAVEPDAHAHNREYHSALLGACGNTLLVIAAQPIFSVLMTNIDRSGLRGDFLARVHDDHRRITRAVQAGDGDAAADEMARHLRTLRPVYERVWLHS
jgi:DNA-binding FadR family transcriptional regulator